MEDFKLTPKPIFIKLLIFIEKVAIGYMIAIFEGFIVIAI